MKIAVYTFTQITHTDIDQVNFSNFRTELGGYPPRLGPSAPGDICGVVSYVLTSPGLCPGSVVRVCSVI